MKDKIFNMRPGEYPYIPIAVHCGESWRAAKPCKMSPRKIAIIERDKICKHRARIAVMYSQIQDNRAELWRNFNKSRFPRWKTILVVMIERIRLCKLWQN